MGLLGPTGTNELWAKVKDGFARKLALVKASTTIDINHANNFAIVLI